MAYKIIYDSDAQKYEVCEKKHSHFYAYCAVAFAIFVMLTCLFWPEGKRELQDLLIPGDNAVTMEALENMKDSLIDGADLKTAVSGFCREIIHGA